MVKALVIGDLHFDTKPVGLLEAQAKAIVSICKEQKGSAKEVIFLGDLMMHRNPRPEVLLTLKKMLADIVGLGYYHITILRGNHDSITKADDGSTSLELFWHQTFVSVVCHTEINYKREWAFIPHYEDQERIRKELNEVPEGFVVFGHFGYNGVLNSAGDADFNLSLSDFKNPTILGHIHRESTNQNVSIIGTPYTTNFGEAGKDCYYGILEGTQLIKVPFQKGPRHLVVDYEDVEDNLDWINDTEESGTFTLLRILITSINEDQNKIADLCSRLNVGHVEVKYKPLIDDKDEFVTDTQQFSTALSEDLIEHYINSSNTKISKEALLDGLKILYEDKQIRDQ